mgnify:CR=1 FL=1
MAYPYYPMTYQPNYYGQPYQPQYQPMAQQPAPVQQQPTAQTAQPQIQNGGFVSVANIEVARNWPIAPGNSVTFKDENAPYVYTKTMGFSQLDRPAFEVYRLVKEEAAQTAQNAPASASNSPGVSVPDYALKSDLDALSGLVDNIKGELTEFRTKLDGITDKKPARATKEKEAD